MPIPSPSVRRPRRPAQRRQIHAVQPPHRHAARDRDADRRHDARRHRAAGRMAGRAVRARRHRRHVRRQRGSAARARARARPAGDAATRISSCSSWMDAKGLVPGDREIAQVVRVRRTGRSILADQQDGRQARQAGALSSISSASSRSSRCRPSTAKAWATCSTPSSQHVPALAADAGTTRRPSTPATTASRSSRRRPRCRDRGVGGDRRTAQRRQVVAGQSVAARGADDRQRVPGTTRDAVDTVMTWHRRQFRIVDTAGIRRPGRVAGGGQVESVSVLLARRSIEHADIVVLVVDATDGRDRPGCGDRRRSGPAGPRHHHRRQQVGPDEGAGPGVREAVRREPAATS